MAASADRRRRRAIVSLALVLCGTLVIGGSLVIGFGRNAPVAAAPAPVEALLVGDSMMHSMAQPYGARARALLAERHSFVLDTAGCRRLVTTSCRLAGGTTPTNAITAIRGHVGEYDRALVMAVGYNDTTSGAGGVEGAVDLFLSEAGAQGVAHVIWLTYREAGPSAARFRAHNSMLRAKAATNPALVIADWAALSATLPTGWFSSDGIHLGADAVNALADLIADTLDSLPPPAPPVSVCRISDTPSNPPLAPTGGGGSTIDGPASALAPTRRLNLWCP